MSYGHAKLATKTCIFASFRYPFVLFSLRYTVDFTKPLKWQVQVAIQQSWQDEMVRTKGKAPSRNCNSPTLDAVAHLL